MRVFAVCKEAACPIENYSLHALMIPFTYKRGSQAAISLSAVSLFSIFVSQPAQAAARSQSLGGFLFTNFSTTALSTDSSSSTSTLTFGTGADAVATADALFNTQPSAMAQPSKGIALNNISSLASTLDTPGSALAESEAGIIGSFALNPGDLFSFDFSGFLDLLTATDRPSDFATASLQTRYAIFSEDRLGNSVELDFLDLFGEISTPDGADDVEVTSSKAIKFSQLDIAKDTGASKTSESISVEVAGRYERRFDQKTTLTLAELKLASAFSESQAATDIPEPSSPWVWLMGIGGAIALSQRVPRGNSIDAMAPQFSH
jgi:hypothetical protein